MAKKVHANIAALRQYAKEFDQRMEKFEFWHLKNLQTHVRACGTIAVKVAAQYTPPNIGKVSYTDTFKKDSEGIKRLRTHVAQDLQGGENDIVYGLPFKKANGKWDYISVDQGGAPTLTRRRAPSGLVVPITRRRGLPMTSNIGNNWLKNHTQFRPAKRGKREARAGGPITFTSESAIKRIVAQQRERAGKLLSGWAPAAAAFKRGKAPAGLYPKLGGKGFAKISLAPVKDKKARHYAWIITNCEFPNDRSNPINKTMVRDTIIKICQSRLKRAIKPAKKRKIQQ